MTPVFIFSRSERQDPQEMGCLLNTRSEVRIVIEVRADFGTKVLRPRKTWSHKSNDRFESSPNSRRLPETGRPDICDPNGCY